MVTHQQVDAVNRFLHTTYGRERTCRLIQYFARFYAFYLTRQGAPKVTVQRWNDLKQHVGNARKFFRLLKPIEFAQTGIKALDTKDEVLRATGVLKQLGMGLYYSAEVFVLTNAIQFYQPKNIKQITDFGQKCWLLGITASLLSGIYKLKLLGVRYQMLVKERTYHDNEKDDTELKKREMALEKERHSITYQLVQDALDFTIPSSALGWLPLDDGIVGIAGIITSLMCMNTQWQKSNP
ncbi:peroxisomal biogenesis factor 11 [Halteromyces radiatus]|uniref:peroxisomal biogenesis factor 11 n=1 Tax=Halteromyces radiatus TaxID=101107 RepID=UPI0022210D99|nr:peroxisomal biogenesis factor 11 [Halteromyces radiatus]KAI8097655.1 peroxisomal biogenesis factor 11 [Halteromyces radiatus]